MTSIIKSIHKIKENFEYHMEGFTQHHPCLAFFAMFIGMPMFVLGAVFVSTALITLPFAWLGGWM